MRKIIKKQNTGFTLIEMMIAITIFLFVVMIGMTALLNAGAVHNNSKNMNSIMDNLSFIMDDMSRNIRTGFDYQCLIRTNTYSSNSNLTGPASCDDGFGIAFENAEGNVSSNNDQWIYYFKDGKIYKLTTGISDNPVQLNPDEIVIDSSQSGFSVLGAEPTSASPVDNQQPLVVIRMTGSITYHETKIPFSIQTSVSQRLNAF